jgi:hypothetical protein
LNGLDPIPLFEWGIRGWRSREVIEIVPVERKQIARHQILNGGPVSSIL